MLNILGIILIIILSPIILMAAIISLFILLAIIFIVGAWIVSIPIAIAKEIKKKKQVRKWQKQEDQRNIQK